jgi:hypothetical protein
MRVLRAVAPDITSWVIVDAGSDDADAQPAFRCHDCISARTNQSTLQFRR